MFFWKKHPLPFSSIRSCRRIPDDGTLPFIPGKLASQTTLAGRGFRFLYSKDSYFSSCVMAEAFSMFHVEHSQGTSPANALPHPMTAAEIRRGFCTGAPKQSNLSQTGKSSLSSLADCLVWTETFLPARTLRFPLPVFPASFGFCSLSCLGASPSLFHVEHLQSPSKHHTITSPP